jgi:hypothetical protein
MLCLFCLAALALVATASAAGHGNEAALDPIMGEFAGDLSLAAGQTVKAEGKVIADENNNYRIVILYPAGDPKATRIELAGTGKDGKVTIKGEASGSVTKEDLAITLKQGTAKMTRVERKSPTLGKHPPAGAVVLLPFEEGKPTNLDQWVKNQWTCQPDGSVLARGGDIGTKQQFGDCKLHVELCVPFMPAARGQGRGNSGVYMHGRYEIQVLDSFGLTENPGECAAIYGQKAACVNASLPPGQWQTYDVDFKAPKFDDAGKQIKGAVITVVHNGVKVIDAFETKNVTGGAWGAPAKTGPVRLQFHGNPVRFRNTWLVEG